MPVAPTVLVIYDGSEGAQHALDAAARLAKASSTPLTVLLLADASDAARRLEQDANHQIEPRGVHLRFHTLHEADVHSLLRAIQSEGGGLIVLSGGSALLSQETIQKMLDRIRNPVLLVR